MTVKMLPSHMLGSVCVSTCVGLDVWTHSLVGLVILRHCLHQLEIRITELVFTAL